MHVRLGYLTVSAIMIALTIRVRTFVHVNADITITCSSAMHYIMAKTHTIICHMNE